MNHTSGRDERSEELNLKRKFGLIRFIVRLNRPNGIFGKTTFGIGFVQTIQTLLFNNNSISDALRRRLLHIEILYFLRGSKYE